MPTLFKGAGQITIDPGGANIVINRDQQLGEITVVPRLATSPLNTQGSSEPVGVIQTGVGVEVRVSIADMDLRNQIMSMAFNTPLVQSGQDQKVVLYDLAGTKINGRKIIIKPYAGLIPDSNQNNWIIIPNAQITASEPNFTYGLTTQQQIQITFSGMPDATGAKLIFGNEGI